MTVYARSDVAAVSISPDHGGCGESHSRPVVEGAPVKLWALTCHGGCEDVLRNDAHWAGTPHTIPETPDEEAIRLDVEKKGQAELAINNAESLAAIAGLANQLPTALSQALVQALGAVNATTLAAPPTLTHLCRSGHPNLAGTKFCSECGANMLDAANKQPVAALSAPEEAAPVEDGVTVTPVEKSSEPVTDDLDGKSYTELKAIAKDRGLKVVPSRAEQLDIVKKAGA